jgi:hypothetical protein
MKIGPTFGQELNDAGLGGLPFAWTTEGEFTGTESLDDAQKQTLNEVVAAHDPTKEIVPDPMEKFATWGQLVDLGLVAKEKVPT